MYTHVSAKFDLNLTKIVGWGLIIFFVNCMFYHSFKIIQNCFHSAIFLDLIYLEHIFEEDN